MANTYYDSTLTAAQIQAALKAINDIIKPANNGKVLAVQESKIVAKSVSDYTEVPTLGSKTITANGTYNPASDNLDGYDSVAVNVPNSYAAGDEGKVVSNGALVAQTAHAKVTQNGTIDTTLNNSVEVDVSGSGGTLIEKSITQNGTYNASSDNADGYSKVVVNVSGGGGGVTKIGYSGVTFVNTTTDDNIGDATSNHITTSIASSNAGGMAPSGTEQMIYTQLDVSDFNFIVAKVYSAEKNTNTTYGGIVVGIDSSLPATYNDAKSVAKKQTINQSSNVEIYTIDVSELTGTYYIFYSSRIQYSSSGYCRAEFEFIAV